MSLPNHEISKEQAREYVENARALERLKQNPDFQRIVVKGYLRDEPVRLVHLKAHESMQTPEKQASIILQIDAIGNLNSYFGVINHFAMLGEKALEDYDEAENYSEEGAE